MAGWSNLKSMLHEEIRLRQEEGCNTDGFTERAKALETDAEREALYDELMRLVPRADYPWREPNELTDILAATLPDRDEWAADILARRADIPETTMRDYFQGAWMGRCIGCALGKPLEAHPFMGGDSNAPGWQHVMRWFAGAGDFPITGYTPSHSTAETEFGLNINRYCHRSLREEINYMESDDDIRYTVFGLIMTERFGSDFDAWDVGRTWHNTLPYSYVCTAETQAYLNFAQRVWHGCKKPADIGPDIDYARTYRNPYRELIGAQIRVDAYAYAAAGDLALATKMAHADASFSHVRNGIYGAMFIAGMISAAFVDKDPRRIVEAGLRYVPTQSRLYADLRKTIEITASATSQLDLTEKLWNAFSHYSCIHTNNNAALCAASVLFGQGDFTRAVTTSVLGGWDTDCNGATVGSIMGAMLGRDAIPANWKEPLHDTLRSGIVDFHPIAISECADKSFAVWNKLKVAMKN